METRCPPTRLQLSTTRPFGTNEIGALCQHCANLRVAFGLKRGRMPYARPAACWLLGWTSEACFVSCVGLGHDRVDDVTEDESAGPLDTAAWPIGASKLAEKLETHTARLARVTPLPRVRKRRGDPVGNAKEQGLIDGAGRSGNAHWDLAEQAIPKRGCCGEETGAETRPAIGSSHLGLR